jgi:glutamine kinase
MSQKIFTISYTRVSADIFHYGHLRLLKKAKEMADYHVCGLYSDEVCIQWNGNLIMKYKKRSALLESLDCVDEVFEQKELDPINNLKRLHKRFPHAKIIFFQGHQEWEALPGTNYVKSIGGEIVKPDYYSKLTLSKIRDKLNNALETDTYDIESYLLGDVSYFTLSSSTKANTLALLKPHLEKSFIEELFVFTKLQWEVSSEEVLSEISKKYNGKIVVRSSSLIEDGHLTSYAGFFHSELNIDSQNMNQVKDSISKVIASYSKHKNKSQDDQILVQSQTSDVMMSGVVFTRNNQNNSPYYLINYDRSSITDTVTSGEVGNKIEIINSIDINKLDPPWSSLIGSVKEIERSLHNMALDIEFAIKNSGDIVIFQVRPISTIQKYKNIPDKNIFKNVHDIVLHYIKLSQNSNGYSHYTLSDMSFWNPAEIIGDRAGNLSYSIYRYLILHEAWNSGLVPLGYKKINRDLVVRLGNKPYIEVETAFLALLPEELDASITRKLVIHYRNKLERNPELHDKIEFDIVHNCFSPVTDDQLVDVKSVLGAIEYQEFRNSIINMTQNIFNNYTDHKTQDLKSLEILAGKRKRIFKEYKVSSIYEKIQCIIRLLEDAREYATPQFSRFARLAFIGNQYLKGLVAKGVLLDIESESFLSNIDTIASDLNLDYDRVVSKKLSVSEFNRLYGHLRPGTYDINRLPYSKHPEYFSLDHAVTLKGPNREKSIGRENIEKPIQSFLDEFEITISAKKLLDFIEETTKYRESFKFEFTKNLSQALEYLSEVGNKLGFNREMLSHLSVESLTGILQSSSTMGIIDLWKSQIEGKKARENLYQYIALPSLVFNAKDFENIQTRVVRPNYITNLVVKGTLINLDSVSNTEYTQVANKIVILEKADPGYDWIFSKGILGLITRFGGAASHMAIRCAEFGIPAAIGCGEVIFKKIKNHQVVEIDCLNKLITTIR